MNNEIRKIVHTYGIEYICEKREKKNIILFIIVTFSLYYIYYLYLVSMKYCWLCSYINVCELNMKNIFCCCRYLYDKIILYI